MDTRIPVRFFIAGIDDVPIAIDRETDSGSSLTRDPGQEPLHDSAPHMTVAGYLAAVCMFLLQKDETILKHALYKTTGSQVIPEALDLTLEKHGPFYHPVRASVKARGTRTSFVVNGAVSEPGLSLAGQEYQLLSRLEKIDEQGFLPKVFGFDTVSTHKGPVSLFLGQWFDNHYEFHATPEPGGYAIGLWLSEGSIARLDPSDACSIFRQAGRILAHFFNPETGEQIFPWHHATGDFIAGPGPAGFDVKLITVRGYQSLADMETGELSRDQACLTNIVHFIVNLGLRMRLDRTDGTKGSAWLPGMLIRQAVEGALEALDTHRTLELRPGIRQLLPTILSSLSFEDLYTISEQIICACNQEASEISLIRTHLEDHCFFFHSCLKDITTAWPGR